MNRLSICLGKEFAPRPKDCSQVTLLRLLMTASAIYIRYDSYFENLDPFSFVHTKNDNPAFPKICTQRTVSKRLYCVAFSAPDPPGGLSMRTRRLLDTGFEVLDFRTSARFRFKSNLEDPLLKALNHLNLQSLTLRQEQVNAIRNVANQK